MDQSFFRPNYIFSNNHYAYFLDFRTQKFPLILFNFKSFLTSTSLAF